MGDSNDSLDDFFAKKDKKKKKTKVSKVVATDFLPPPPGTPPNELSENVDQNAEQVSSEYKLDTSSVADLDNNTSSKEKRKQKKKKDKDGADANLRKEEDEWNAVVDEIDYSGLKITSKNIAKEAAEEAAESAKSEPEYDEDGQVIEKSAEGSVWKITPAEPAVDQPPAPAPAPTPVIAEMPNVSGGKYVPPSRRAGGAAQLTPVSVKKTTRKKVAPNVNSQEDFPTLGATPPTVDYDVSKFERVRGGGAAQQAQTQGEQGRLQTSNMYSALERH